MIKELLKLRPIGYSCPFCGHLHSWENAKPLEQYSEYFPATLTCRYSKLYPSIIGERTWNFFFEYGYLHYYVTKPGNCPILNMQSVNGRIPIDSLKIGDGDPYDLEDPSNPYISFYHYHSTLSRVGMWGCLLDNIACSQKRYCYAQFADKTTFLKIFICFDFDSEEYFKVKKEYEANNKK